MASRKTIIVTARFPIEARAALVELARAMDRPLSVVIRTAVLDYYDLPTNKKTERKKCDERS